MNDRRPNRSTRPRAWLATLGLAAGCLAACGGVDERSRERPAERTAASAAPATTAAAQATPTITVSQLLDWAQRQFTSLFPPGPQNQPIASDGVTYTARYYPGTGNYLGVADASGAVYGYGPFNGYVLTSYGLTTDFACDVLASCTRVTPDADGNLAAGWARAAEFTVAAGTPVFFEGLGPNDSVIEVGSAQLSSAQLCTAAELPAGMARPVSVPEVPSAENLYPTNEFSGPYRTYPAGIYVLSPASDECGRVERNGNCVAPGEMQVAAIRRPDGGTDALCVVSPTLTNPPRANPACVPGRLMDATWADPAVAGVFLRLSWNDLQPRGYGQYDWTMLDRELAQAVRYGKTVTLGIRVGGNSIPDWVFTTGDPQLGPAKPLRLRDWDTGANDLPDADCGTEYVVASPADPAYRALFGKALRDMAAHIRADRRRFAVVAGVKITGLAQHTLENRLPKRCNIAARHGALGDTGTQGHIVSLSTRNLSQPVFDSDYMQAANPAFGRIRDVSLCVCNPQVMAFAGFKPSTVVAFYNEMAATLRAAFGHKQLIYMNLSAGFPRVGETGRFEGDHLAPPIVSSNTAAGLTTYVYGSVRAAPAQSPADIPQPNDITTMVFEAGRRGEFAPGQPDAGRQFGVENAALQPIGFSQPGGNTLQCSQQSGIATAGAFTGSAAFPIAADAVVDNSGAACPNFLAAKEGIAHDKTSGFQVTSSLQGAADIDAALWNLTLNTNGVFFEYYESDNWVTRKQAALNPGNVFDPEPPVRDQAATANRSAATAKTGVAWNSLLRARAAAFSADPRRQNPFQADPFPTRYVVNVASAPGSVRYLFNSRACTAWAERGVPVRVNRVTIAN
jgi:hypothetical protein